MSKIKSVSLRLATEEDQHLPFYDNTRLQAMNTCPTWAVVRYGLNKTYPTTSRAMALEAGSAMHDVFAAVRLWQLWHYDLKDAVVACNDVGVPSLVTYHGPKLFGKDRFEHMLEMVNPDEDERTNCINFCLQALFESGFYDDPSDRRRTMTNLEEAAILYIDRWDFKRNPIWVRDINDPKSDVGIEIGFDVVITFELEDGTTKSYRFIGKLDGLHVRDGNHVVGENKTASRIDEGWRASFEMSSQVTGYCLAGSVFSGQPVEKGIVWGLAIPLPKSYDSGGLAVEYVSRPSHMFENWFAWFLHTVEMYEANEGNPHDAPRYTHSCNRYFRACSLIPFCASDREEQELGLSEMVEEVWNPLEE